MASRVHTVTTRVVTRRPGDIDPKIAGVFAVAAATIGLVAAAVTVAHLLGQSIDPAVFGYVVPPLAAAAVGYLRKSRHAELVEDGVDAAAQVAADVAPALEQLIPEAAPAIQEAVDGIQYLQGQLEPAGPASTTAP